MARGVLSKVTWPPVGGGAAEAAPGGGRTGGSCHRGRGCEGSWSECHWTTGGQGTVGGVPGSPMRHMGLLVSAPPAWPVPGPPGGSQEQLCLSAELSSPWAHSREGHPCWLGEVMVRKAVRVPVHLAEPPGRPSPASTEAGRCRMCTAGVTGRGLDQLAHPGAGTAVRPQAPGSPLRDAARPQAPQCGGCGFCEAAPGKPCCSVQVPRCSQATHGDSEMPPLDPHHLARAGCGLAPSGGSGPTSASMPLFPLPCIVVLAERHKIGGRACLVFLGPAHRTAVRRVLTLVLGTHT